MAEQYTIKESDLDGKEKKNPYWLAYIKATGLKVGDSWTAVDYMEWITEKHDTFRAQHKLPDFIQYNEAQQKAFLEFIGYAEKEGKDNGRG